MTVISTPLEVRRTARPLSELTAVRVALTGQTISPGIFEIMGAMGRELSLERLTDAHAWLARA